MPTSTPMTLSGSRVTGTWRVTSTVNDTVHLPERSVTVAASTLPVPRLRCR